MLRTMSSSSAPSAIARRASNAFAAVVEEPCGKATTAQGKTSDPASTFAASRTSAGRTQAEATP